MQFYYVLISGQRFLMNSLNQISAEFKYWTENYHLGFLLIINRKDFSFATVQRFHMDFRQSTNDII